WTTERIMMRESGRNRTKAGITSVNSDGDHKIIDAKIRITTANGFSRKYVADSEAASVAMHEVGHAFGLGHSSSVKDVMYFGSSSQHPGDPGARDRATIARLYADYPVVGFTPKAPIPTEPIKYLPPPAFVPPQPPPADKLVPPLFMPPPLRTEEDKLTPPLSTPPPLTDQQKSEPQRDKQPGPTAPLFVPPPLQKTGGEKSNTYNPPFFTPPPAH